MEMHRYYCHKRIILYIHVYNSICKIIFEKFLLYNIEVDDFNKKKDHAILLVAMVDFISAKKLMYWSSGQKFQNIIHVL